MAEIVLSQAGAVAGRALLPQGVSVLGQTLGGAVLGRTLGRWDRHAQIDVLLPEQQLASKSETAVLNGENRLLVQGDIGAEFIGFLNAELIDVDTWRLTGLLRGLQGSPIQAFESGAIISLADDRLLALQMSDAELSLDLVARAGLADVRSFRFDNAADLMWRVGHLRKQQRDGGTYLTWTARARDFPESWAVPETSNSGVFRVELTDQAGVTQTVTVSQPEVLLTGAYVAANVIAIGTDGRAGRRVSIML